MSKITYRPDIDGLRALAVLAVIIFHLNENWLPGGFLGVDIFFVISGYLITQIITQEMYHNQFSFREFYKRRIKRIYPVFALTMAIALVIASAIFVYNDFNQLRKTIELSTIFFSNFYLANTQGYFDLNASENPVLHIWSLSVEEQYYLFFPVLLYWLIRRGIGISRLFIITLFLAGILILLSFISDKLWLKIGVMDNYYNSFLRFPELFIGSLLALWQMKVKNVSPRTAQYINLIGFLGIIACLFLYRKDLPFIPGLALLLPCIFTSLIIYFQGSLFTRILSLPIIVFIGKISYSLYLFHWIIISFTFYITGVKSLSYTMIGIVLLLTFTCSILSYFLFETPIRRSSLGFKQAFIFLYLIPSLLIVSYGYGMRTIIKKQHMMLESIETIQNNQPVSAVVIGDSHAGHLSNFLTYVGQKEGWKADIWDQSEKQICFSFLLPSSRSIDSKQKEYCRDIETELNSDKYSVVMVSLFYNLKIGKSPVPRFSPQTFVVENFEQKFVESVTLLAKNKQVIIFGDVPTLNRSPQRNFLLEKYGLARYLDPIREFGDISQINTYIANLVKDIPNVRFVDLSQYISTDYIIDNKPIYSDQDHLTDFGSLYLGKQFHKYQKRLITELK
ncbi:acyltransferase family protein [Rodentibacter haemolyticus]|uniref:Acyltransferase family protein n=1 Tax=Rodentibacter haemolyticus TaxID=2778911 RepID=A0ABX6UVR3_9PAST|nr:acyltransferase family protein [Rodentibacter haemolyticus]QPB42069.1 acyltransferase family protein [Rodentibacter haemolyticus]